MHKTGFIILAGGKGKRFNSTIPKQFHKIGKYNSIEIILNEINNNKKIDIIVIVYNDKNKIILNKIKNKYKHKKIKFVKSGISRQISSLNGLESLKNNNIKKVLIHDGCRPWITNKQINLMIKLLDKYDACAPIILNADLPRLQKGNQLIELDSKIYLTQTPQGFKYNKIIKANNNYKFFNAKDDIELINNKKNKVKFIEGDRRNIKITYKNDINYFNFIKQKNIRYGIGYDIHSFDLLAKRKLKLCGVKINYYPLKGHSDADVGYHALCDSIFGALGIGDIGRIFKNNDLRWRNANSKIFLEYAKRKIDESNSKIINIDINFICEKPKISKYSEKMKTNISKILFINKSQINIKATTNEKIGFIGKGEAIAAESIISLSCE